MEKNTNIEVSLEDAVERLFYEWWSDEFPNIKFSDSGPTGKYSKKLFMSSFAIGLKWSQDMTKPKLDSAITTIKDVDVLVRLGKLGGPGSMFFEEFYERTLKMFPELNISKPNSGDIKNG